jgi:hypothetical protein
MFNRKDRAKSKLLKDLAMFASFMGISGCVYFFHVFQNEPSTRGYLTAFSLLLAYCFQFQQYDKRMSTMWACFFAWVVSSNVYYDLRTHLYGYYRLARHVLFVFFVVAAVVKKIKHSKRMKILFWLIIAFGPDISSNVYGNALFSILRIFACTIIIMTRQEPEPAMEEFVWVYFCHETVLFFVIVQILFDFLPIEFQLRWPPIRTVKNKQPSDVIGEADVPFLDRRIGGTIIGAKGP